LAFYFVLFFVFIFFLGGRCRLSAVHRVGAGLAASALLEHSLCYELVRVCGPGLHQLIDHGLEVSLEGVRVCSVGRTRTRAHQAGFGSGEFLVAETTARPEVGELGEVFHEGRHIG